MKFDWKETETGYAEAKERSPQQIKDGIYTIRIIAAEDQVSKKSGAEMIAVTAFDVEVASEGHKRLEGKTKEGGSYGIYYITTHPYFFKRNIIAFGLLAKYEAAAESGVGSLGAADFIGKTAVAIVLTQSEEVPNGKVYRKTKVVEVVEPGEDASAIFVRLVRKRDEKEGVIIAKTFTPQDAPAASMAKPLGDEIPF